MWFWAHIGFIYTVGRLPIDDTATPLPARDIFTFLSAQDCINFLRFSREQIIITVQHLCVPDMIRTDCGYVIAGRTALCVLLYRLAFPCRYKDMRLIFHRSDSCLCETFNYMLHFMNETWGSMLTLDLGRLVPRLDFFAERLQTWGCPLPNCWAFIDGTVRAICRTIREQRAFFNGHKRYHAIKLQSVVTPDGIMVDLFGPELGTRHDVHLLHESGVLVMCQEHMNSASGDPYVVYGDPAYGMSTHLNCPYSAEAYGPLSAGMIEFNKQMSACRVAVEWVFKEMTSKWAFVALKNQQKHLLSPIGVRTVHPQLLERGQRDLPVFRVPTAVVRGVPGCCVRLYAERVLFPFVCGRGIATMNGRRTTTTVLW
ncbi:conserved unknown protein [Ectocarpus siliculosus]|uniref:DDE Tnp4 domain-containing protein n=1 Tax=Ectocarpus siliculosus TaxID=2880 RepID=D7G2E5_ECTSI|nr:conserved unknown protein [Ectocarpus siliculosus]|eukprot:CBJ33379.1 conserved unknown protein [Ectocarpus siliculosus]